MILSAIAVLSVTAKTKLLPLNVRCTGFTITEPAGGVQSLMQKLSLAGSSAAFVRTVTLNLGKNINLPPVFRNSKIREGLR